MGAGNAQALGRKAGPGKIAQMWGSDTSRTSMRRRGIVAAVAVGMLVTGWPAVARREQLGQRATPTFLTAARRVESQRIPSLPSAVGVRHAGTLNGVAGESL